MSTPEKGFVPEGFEEYQVGNYMKLKNGANRIRILENPITGYVYWKDSEGNVVPKDKMAGAGGKPVRVRSYKGLSKEERGAIKAFTAMVAWNYEVNKVQILEIKQIRIMNALQALLFSKSWGDVKDYDIIITKSKTGPNTQDVEYSVMPEPKEELPEEISQAYEKAGVNIQALYDGKDPFSEEVTLDDDLDFEKIDLDDLGFTEEDLEDLDGEVETKNIGKKA